MAPKRARTVSDAHMSQVDFRSLSDLWKMAQTPGVDWALQKLTEGPDKDPQLVAAAPLPKQQRKAPGRYRDSSPGIRATTSMQPGAAAVVQSESTVQSPSSVPEGKPPDDVVGDTSLGAKDQINL
ncbi:hypothetical protein NDU88_005660 [Pleurodeles waltl]|uniref:Uncharacterized protein n=1 Tax=Pleurodeles waltl TaxID=8319 RepID=A0AAV7LLU1_PLEWA|nr:hypothetical protein NDU88_005660 [Pleurodeles waltl]